MLQLEELTDDDVGLIASTIRRADDYISHGLKLYKSLGLRRGEPETEAFYTALLNRQKDIVKKRKAGSA